MTAKTTGNDELYEKKQENDFPDESSQTDYMQPLIIKQAPNNPKGTKSLPYNFGSETYSVYSNLKIRLWWVFLLQIQIQSNWIQ